MLKRNEGIHPHSNLYMNVCNSIIKESKVEATQMSINREMSCCFFFNLLLLTMEYYLVIKRNEVLMYG